MADLSAMIICLSLLLYLLLDGTDLGVGMLFFWFHDDQQRDHDPPAGLPERPAAEGTLPLPGVAGALAAERGEGRVRRDSAYPGRRCDRPGE